MTPTQAWRRLGIKPTDDERAIRRAYAAKLKALDVDADPAGFEALRAARERALWIAREALHRESWNEHDAADEAADDEPAADAPVDGREIEPAADDRPADDPYTAHVEALHDQLYGGDTDVPFDADERTAALADLTAALADPRLDEIDRRFDAEHWFAMTLAETSPRSDPLLDPAAAFFGWRERAGRIEGNWWVERVNARIDALAFRAQLIGGGHRWSRAWRELTRPVSESGTARRNLFIRNKTVQALLRAIRTDHPGLEQELQPQRVYAADAAPQWGCTSSWVLAVIAVQLVLAIARCNPSDRPVEPVPVNVVSDVTLSDEGGDIAAAIQSALGANVSEAALARHQPELRDLLHTNWRIFRDGGNSRREYVTEMDRLIRARTARARPAPGSALFLEDARNRLHILIALRGSPDRCAAFAEGKLRGTAGIPVELDQEARKIGQRIRLEGTPDPTSGPVRFTIAGAVIGKIIDRSGLSEARVRAGLRPGAPPADACRVAIALREVALELPPKQRDALLRYL